MQVVKETAALIIEIPEKLNRQAYAHNRKFLQELSHLNLPKCWWMDLLGKYLKISYDWKNSGKAYPNTCFLCVKASSNLYQTGVDASLSPYLFTWFVKKKKVFKYFKYLFHRLTEWSLFWMVQTGKMESDLFSPLFPNLNFRLDSVFTACGHHFLFCVLWTWKMKLSS